MTEILHHAGTVAVWVVEVTVKTLHVTKGWHLRCSPIGSSHKGCTLHSAHAEASSSHANQYDQGEKNSQCDSNPFIIFHVYLHL